MEYIVPAQSRVRIENYNVIGQLVGVLVDDVREAGMHQVSMDMQNMRLACGVYIYRMVTQSEDGNLKFEKTRKMTILN